MIKIECTNCDYRTADMQNVYIARTASEMHVMLGPEHQCKIIENGKEIERVLHKSLRGGQSHAK